MERKNKQNKVRLLFFVLLSFCTVATDETKSCWKKKRSKDLREKQTMWKRTKKQTEVLPLFQMGKATFGQEKLSEKQKKKFLSKVLFLSKDLI